MNPGLRGMRNSRQSPFQTYINQVQSTASKHILFQPVGISKVHRFWIAENLPNIWFLLLLEIMLMTQFDFPKKYEYLVGSGLYHQYSNHQIMNPTMGRSNAH